MDRGRERRRLDLGANGPAQADEGLVGLITKTNNNPFFAKMKVGAEEKAKELGVEVPILRRQV